MSTLIKLNQNSRVKPLRNLVIHCFGMLRRNEASGGILSGGPFLHFHSTVQDPFAKVASKSLSSTLAETQGGMHKLDVLALLSWEEYLMNPVFKLNGESLTQKNVEI